MARLSPATQDHEVVGHHRGQVRSRLTAAGLEEAIDAAQLVTSELVTNALLHGGGLEAFALSINGTTVRVEARDRRPLPPLLGQPSTEAMTGRGILLVARLATRWGVDPAEGGKVVWAEIDALAPERGDLSEAELLEAWSDVLEAGSDGPALFHVELGEVPTGLLLAAKSHVDNLLREFTLASSGARHGLSAELAPHLESLIDVVTSRFAEPRESIKRQALQAAHLGLSRTNLALDLEPGAAAAARDYLAALDAIDAYCRAGRLLTLETPPQHRVFRRWYIEELVRQVDALADGRTPPPPQPFETRLLDEIDSVVSAHLIAERAARLHALAGALAVAASPSAVADAVLREGVAALDAVGGGILLADPRAGIVVPGTVGYHEDLVARLRAESVDDELPAAVALRTGNQVWIESKSERDEHFPALVDLEPSTVSMCAVPLEVGERRLGALRFSFSDSRLFDDDERRFVLALAAQSAQALDRAQLQQARIAANLRLQRSLLPPSLPVIPGAELAAMYHPLGDGMEVGGDFYDVWPIGDDTFGLSIGDVAGTGPEAAAYTALVRQSLRALTLRSGDIPATLVDLNAVLRSSADGDESEMFCTAIFATVRQGSSGLDVILGSGGHPLPFIRRADGMISEIPLGGSLLGTLSTVDIAVAKVRLERGDLLVLVTDGVLEARNNEGDFFDVDGLVHVLAEAGGDAGSAVAALESAVLNHVSGHLGDDVAALVLRVT